MKKSSHKNGIVITALALMIIAAGYLNFTGQKISTNGITARQTASPDVVSEDTADISAEDIGNDSDTDVSSEADSDGKKTVSRMTVPNTPLPTAVRLLHLKKIRVRQLWYQTI